MARWNGTETAVTANRPESMPPVSGSDSGSSRYAASIRTGQVLSPEENPVSSLQIWVLRIWIACALIIVASGVANYLLCQFFGEK